MSVEDVVHRTRPAAGDPEGVLVLMHGRGVDESDLLPLLDLLDPERRLAGYTPRAPHSLPGQPGFHWYAVERVGYPHRETFAPTYELMSRWLDELVAEHGVGADRLVLGGFSQGAVMSHALGLGRGRPTPAAVVGLSGFVPVVDGWEPDLDPRADLPVYVSHGVNDPVIPVEFARRARELLEGRVRLTYRETAAGHFIDPRTFEELAGWLAKVLSRDRGSAGSTG
jgi:phospholipase/carboxylesterase